MTCSPFVAVALLASVAFVSAGLGRPPTRSAREATLAREPSQSAFSGTGASGLGVGAGTRAKPVALTAHAASAPTLAHSARLSPFGVTTGRLPITRVARLATAPLAAAASLAPIAHAANLAADEPVFARSVLIVKDRLMGIPRGGPHPLSSALTATVPGTVARILPDGYAAAPAGAPASVQQAIWAGNQLIGLPYVYGGGHGSFVAAGYDCSGSVSWALHGGGLITAPLDSIEYMGWGAAGRGSWITVYTNYSHAFVEIAGIRLDTSTAGDIGGEGGPRWRPLLHDTAGYALRHPWGY